SSFEKLRGKLLHTDIVNMTHLGARAFEEIGGEVVQTTSFVIRKSYAADYKGEYCRLIEPTTQQGKEDMFLAGENRYSTNQFNFSKIPGSPVSYWVSVNVLSTFECSLPLSELANPKQGLITGDVNRFVRKWYECVRADLSTSSSPQNVNRVGKWFPYCNGGEFRKWYGNNDDVVNWQDDGFEIKNFVDDKGKPRSRPQNQQYYFHEGGTWTAISSSLFSVRYFPEGYLFSNAGMAIYAEPRKLKYIIGFLNSKLCQLYLSLLNESLNYNQGDIAKLPIIFENVDLVVAKVVTSIDIVKKDWDSFETSWDFQHHPLLRNVPTIAEAFIQWQAECADRFNQLKANEEALNRIFIDIYGLQDELTPEVEDKDVTVRKADLGRDIRSFISYAVGCMFGRYSLDVDGLAYAGGEWGASKYASFAADKDNIIPICDDEYFEDDIVGLFVEFVKTVYGADTLDENLKFIADALGGKGQPKNVIRNYFLSDFYSDHCKIYQKRPIYWLFDSGKKNGFKALIYMHRYKPDTIARIRTDYVHEQQARYRTAIANLEQRIANASTGERVKLNKKLVKLQVQDTELRKYEEKIHHLADQMISIDLDDGVKKNYAIFQDVLAKIK
ncbi:BREX-1 system adenine-specific DNA-methyltransferase PglX, partial [Roseburia hominis]|uniref:BREX-1 system adenine-specific DNA-methyltransferase PglX n=1 Tax=Roseburia hominis TaxID=301301 RepID=UPI00307DBBA9